MEKIIKPLADILRPTSLNEVVGQDHLLKNKGAIKLMVESGKVTSFLLWGPPGCGKTTIAKLMANNTNLYFENVSAVFSGVADLKKIFNEAELRQKQEGKGTLLFVDEIHRFNRSQQDSFLPYVENGTVILVGATTANPSFELNSALLSRCRVLVLKPLDFDALRTICIKALEEVKNISLTEEAISLLVSLSDGDGRYLINMVESLSSCGIKEIDEKILMELVSKKSLSYDKDRDEHYNLISALHKSLRGSDVDAALYYMARMLEGGEDPRYIIRRLVRFSFEDISLADPNALNQAISVATAYERLGSPEAELAIAGLVCYLATAPKSNAVYSAYKDARALAKKYGSLMPPKHILNAPTKMMKDLGYNKGYIYDHDTEDGFSGQNYFPDEMQRQKIYKPKEIGFEREINKRINYYDDLRKKKNNGK
ncbi:MAG: Replication-associated recombination protein A [Alphaproteobacteria bacterium ADurb.Bin438]|nr:MAG: Replication-associated recombination protein A [Alphaproteobacteria bacterium ADurb.Bin438]